MSEFVLLGAVVIKADTPARTATFSRARTSVISRIWSVSSGISFLCEGHKNWGGRDVSGTGATAVVAWRQQVWLSDVVAFLHLHGGERLGLADVVEGAPPPADVRADGLLPLLQGDRRFKVELDDIAGQGGRGGHQFVRLLGGEIEARVDLVQTIRYVRNSTIG